MAASCKQLTNLQTKRPETDPVSDRTIGTEILVSVRLPKDYLSSCHHISHHKRGGPPGVHACGVLGLGLACSRLHRNDGKHPIKIPPSEVGPRRAHLSIHHDGWIGGWPGKEALQLASRHPGMGAAKQHPWISSIDDYSAGCHSNLNVCTKLWEGHIKSATLTHLE